jgi:hypothetical protein
MTTEIRQALAAVRDGIDVPPPDGLRFRAAVRSERRRRTGVRVVGGLVVASIAVAIGAVAVVGTGADRGTQVADTPEQAKPPASVPVSVDGRLALVEPDGSVISSGVRVDEVVGTVTDGVVVLGRDRHVRLVPVAGSGPRTSFGRPRELVGESVKSAHVGKDGLVLGFVDLEGTLHIREVGVHTDFQTDQVDPGVVVLGVSGGVYLTQSEAEGLVLHFQDPDSQSGAQFLRTQVATAFPAVTAELADLTLAVGTSDGVELFDASPSAAPRFGGSLGGEVSSLAPRGDLVATATSADQSARGMSEGVWLLDAFSGEQMPMRDYDGGPALDIAWLDNDEFVVLADSDRGDLWVCDAAALRCEQRLTGSAEKLSLPTS